MHVPDGFINAATSVGTGVVAAGGLGVSLRNAARALRDFHIPLAGVTAALIFALQMLNFPVLPGVSGHLMGGALAAILLGPWMGAVVVSVVVIVQALFFADGGISALGVNVTNIALVTAFVAWPVFRGVLKILPKTRLSAMAAAMVSAFVSVLAGSFAFVLEYALGGVGGAPIGTVLGAMTGIHALIGVGEGLITATALGTCWRSAPTWSKASPISSSPEPTRSPRAGPSPPSSSPGWPWPSPWSCSWRRSPLRIPTAWRPSPSRPASRPPPRSTRSAGRSHYPGAGVESETVGTIVSGIIGTVIAFAIGLGIVAVSRRRARSA